MARQRAPAEQVRGLVEQAGRLEGGPESLLLRIAGRSLPLEEVEREWDAQIRKMRDAGNSPTHLDGHKHVQMLPGLFEIALRLAKKHGFGRFAWRMRSRHCARRCRSGKGNKRAWC